MAQPMILSWCHGQKCDPCKPKSNVHLFIVGSAYSSEEPQIYLYIYASYHTPTVIGLGGGVAIKATSSVNLEEAAQNYELGVGASGYVQSGYNALGMPLPPTDTGIILYPDTKIEVSIEGPVVDKGPLAFHLYEVTISPASP